MSPLQSLLLALPLIPTTLAALTPKEAQSQVLSLINDKIAAKPATLSPLWSSLPPIPVSKALGTYHGGLFTGNNTNVTDPINWYGKQILSETSVNPLLVNPPSSVANAKSIVFPYPRADIAQARNVEHEGIVSATIIYAKLPLLDYLRVVKDEGGELILLGKSDLRGKEASPPYFYLRRVEGVRVDMGYKNPYPNTSGF
ncbi:hypothetical protein EJ08DRAFT_711654 [Tothia fuscella]|uniref:Uncharacterized protein n=1 Tax=Tothia fuscella TaxID=1048955 RepID=A0A9P4P3A9_9PEZI|nr:hypothetical protein EJ08DRAFT_711654 [Tothia fuscella]